MLMNITITITISIVIVLNVTVIDGTLSVIMVTLIIEKEKHEEETSTGVESVDPCTKSADFHRAHPDVFRNRTGVGQNRVKFGQSRPTYGADAGQIWPESAEFETSMEGWLTGLGQTLRPGGRTGSNPKLLEEAGPESPGFATSLL